MLITGLAHKDKPHIHHVGSRRPCDEKLTRLLEETVGIIVVQVFGCAHACLNSALNRL
jgi:hypothetical protein